MIAPQFRCLRRVHRQSGKTTIYVTPSPGEAFAISDKAYVMHEGRSSRKERGVRSFPRRTGWHGGRILMGKVFSIEPKEVKRGAGYSPAAEFTHRLCVFRHLGDRRGTV